MSKKNKLMLVIYNSIFIYYNILKNNLLRQHIKI